MPIYRPTPTTSPWQPGATIVLAVDCSAVLPPGATLAAFPAPIASTDSGSGVTVLAAQISAAAATTLLVQFSVDPAATQAVVPMTIVAYGSDGFTRIVKTVNLPIAGPAVSLTGALPSVLTETAAVTDALASLPTSPTGLPAGAWYLDGGIPSQVQP